MKKILSFLALSLVIISGLFAQSPQKFTYQAVVRDSYNTLVPSKPVGVRISILQGGLNGPVVYSEQHTTVTNANGLMTLQIGGGVLLNGDFSAIDWAAGPYFLKTETDPQGGTNYTVTGAQQLLSVPYALYSEKSADSFSGDYNDLTNTPTIPTTTGELTNDAGFITTADIPDSVSAFINDALYITRDSIPTNVSAFTNDAGYLTSFTEVQALSISNDTIFLTNGGFVKLPAGFDGDYNSLTNKPNIPTSTNDLINNSGFITKDSIPTNVSAFINDALYITRDSIPINVSAFTNDAGYLTSFTEVQALSISNDTIFLTNGGFVKLPAGFDGDYNSLINKPNIPTSTNDLTNNSGFITKDSIPTNVSAFINDALYITRDSIPTNVSAFINDALYITRDSIPTNVSAFTNDAGYLTSFTEVQALSISNDTIFLTNGGFVKLPVGFDGDYNSLTNKPNIPTSTNDLTNNSGFITKDSIPTNVSAFTNDALYITRDSIPTNVSAFTNDAGYLTSFTEVQALSISNDTIFLTNGGFVKLPAGFDGDYNSLTNKPNIPTTTNDLTNNSGFITKDSIPTNVSAFTNDAGYLTSFTEVQALSISNDTIFLTNGGFVKLPAGFDGDYNSLSNKPNIPTSTNDLTNNSGFITKDSIPTNVSAFTNDAGYLTSFTEVQALSISNDTIFLTNGGFVKLPAGFNGDYNSLINTPANVSHFINDANYITKDSIPNTVSTFINDANYITKDSIPTNVSAFTNDAGYLTFFTEVQALSISNDTIFLTNGGFVVLPAGFDGDYNSLTNKPNIPTSTNDLTNNSGFITKDSIPTNVSEFTNDAGYLTSFTEIQALSISNDTIFLTNGGFVKLPAGFDGDYNSLTNKPNIPTSTNDLTNNSGFITKDSIPTTVSTFTNDALYITRDSIPTNVSAFTNDAGYLTSFTEVQALSISNDTIFLTNGGFVKLPAGFDGDYNSLTNTPNIPTSTNDLTNNSGFITKDSIPTNVSAFTNDAGYLTSFTEVQALSISNDTIFLTNGGFVKLPAGFDGDYNSLTNKPNIPTSTNDLTNNSGFITKDSIPTNVSAFTNDANYITKDSIPTNVSAFANDAGYLTKDSICAATASCGYITSADLNLFLGQINDKIDSLKTIINAQAEKIDSLSGNVNNSYIPWDSTGLNPNDSKACQGTPIVTDVDGNVYNTVQIGKQCWMRENLRTTRYAYDTTIIIKNQAAYMSGIYYPDGSSKHKETYGLLYSWDVVMGNSSSSNANPSGVQGICPTGWHVPSNAEWIQLENYVSSQSQYVSAITSSYIAKSLASQKGWSYSTVTYSVGQNVLDNNATGFSALPAGRCYYDSGSHTIKYIFGTLTQFHSCTTSGYYNYEIYRSMESTKPSVSSENQPICASVRCLKD